VPRLPAGAQGRPGFGRSHGNGENAHGPARVTRCGAVRNGPGPVDPPWAGGCRVRGDAAAPGAGSPRTGSGALWPGEVRAAHRRAQPGRPVCTAGSEAGARGGRPPALSRPPGRAMRRTGGRRRGAERSAADAPAGPAGPPIHPGRSLPAAPVARRTSVPSGRGDRADMGAVGGGAAIRAGNRPPVRQVRAIDMRR